MKAPDKCYITREKNGVVYSLSFNDNGGFEYIRKDALIKWAKEHQEGERIGSYTWACYQIIIDKLNSM